MNTIVPYGDPLYNDNRPVVKIDESQVLPINDYLGFNPNMAPLKRLYDEGHVAIIQGIGYPTPNRSHFRSMDIWHTCDPDKVGTEGWLGRSIKALDPQGENVLTGVNFGRSLPRALAKSGVPVASVGNLQDLRRADQYRSGRTEDEGPGYFLPHVLPGHRSWSSG